MINEDRKVTLHVKIVPELENSNNGTGQNMLKHITQEHISHIKT